MTEERDEHIDMTPMVDVVFQLMTFMLFSLQITGNEVVEVPPAHHGVGVDETSAVIITLARPKTAGGEPKILLGNGSGPELSLADLKAAVADGVAHSKSKVVLQADGEVPHGEVVKVIAELAQVDGATIHVGVRAPDSN